MPLKAAVGEENVNPLLNYTRAGAGSLRQHTPWTGRQFIIWLTYVAIQSFTLGQFGNTKDLNT